MSDSNLKRAGYIFWGLFIVGVLLCWYFGIDLQDYKY